MPDYLVIEIDTKKSVVVATLEEAARIAKLDPLDVEWVLEEDGICETDRHTIVETTERQ